MRALAIVATRGTSNNMFQLATLVRAATALEIEVQALFVGDALLKLSRERLNLDEWSAAYAPVRSQIDERLRSADFVDMESFLRDAKEHGDDVKFWADAGTLQARQMALADLTPLLDGSQDATQFLASAARADVLLTF